MSPEAEVMATVVVATCLSLLAMAWLQRRQDA